MLLVEQDTGILLQRLPQEQARAATVAGASDLQRREVQDARKNGDSRRYCCAPLRQLIKLHFSLAF